MNFYKSLLKPLMFSQDPEKAHIRTMKLFHLALKMPFLKNVLNNEAEKYKELKTSLWGLEFPNPIGLAAGFDKDGKYYKEMAALGFGFIEIGTVTPRPQLGNPKPRLFRLPQDQALINRMGFNNDGVDAMVERLRKRGSTDYILGANIGKNKSTPNEKAVDDYLNCFKKLHPYVDYFVVNVSSPNTPGLRELQKEKPLVNILKTLQEENRNIPQRRPIVLKIAPDMSENQLLRTVNIINNINLDGIIATNTTTDRSGLSSDKAGVKSMGNGGLSGLPLREKSMNFLKLIRENTDIPVISVGGIHNPNEAKQRIENGADLIQIYTSLIYNGPHFVNTIQHFLAG